MPYRRTNLPALLATVALSAVAATAGKESEPPVAPSPPGWVRARLTSRGELPDEAARRLVAEVRDREASPAHLVVLLHGFDTAHSRSDKEYAEIASAVRQEFEAKGQSAQVVGLQWPSDVGAMRDWLPRTLGHHLFKAIGLRKAIRDPYKERVLLAGPVGRTGVRKTLLTLQEAFPGASLHVLAHSLGSEVTLHAVDPHHHEEGSQKQRADPPAYEPDRPLRIGIAVFAGADVDEDHALPARGTGGTVNLFWVTLSSPDGPRDRVLILRKLVRGKKALGSAPPKLREEQIDALIGGRRIVFDTEGIPRSHEILRYYDQERCARIAEAAAALRAPDGTRPGLVGRLEQVLAAPGEPDALRPFLEADDASVRIYALWRLEHRFCGDSRHLADGSALKLLEISLKDPARLDRLREASECRVFQQRLWPPVPAAGNAR